MAPNKKRFKRSNQSRSSKRRNPRRRRRATDSPLRNVLSSVYQVVSALPILPEPIKKGADWVARLFGLTTAQYTDTKSLLFNMTDGAITTAEWSGFVRSEIFVTGSVKAGAFNEAHGTLSTNIKSVRPLSITFTLTPQNPVSLRAGYYSIAFFPCTGPESVEDFKMIDRTQLGFERLYNRAPVRGRWPASAGGSLSYTVPKANVFLHNGIPLRPVGGTAETDVVGLLTIIYTRDDRTEYNEFNGDEVAFDLKIKGKAISMQVDPLTPQEINIQCIVSDFNKGTSKFLFRNPSTLEVFPCRSATWDAAKKGFTANTKDLRKADELSLSDMEI